MDQLQQIKSLSNELSENVLFNYSKRGFLLLIEIFGYLLTLGTFIGGLSIFVFVPYITLKDGTEIYVDSPQLKPFFQFLGGFLILLSVLALFLTLYIKRIRRKKAQVYQLTQLIRDL